MSSDPVRVIVVGAGGHGVVVAEALRESRPDVHIAGYVDDNPSLWGQTVLDVAVLGPVNSLASYAHDAIVVGFGDNTSREVLFREMDGRGEEILSALHPRASISTVATLHRGVTVAALATVSPCAVVGVGSIVNTGATVDHHCVLEPFVHIAPGVHLAGGCRIGRRTLIGIGACVAPGRTIGAGTIVGAGSVVVADIPDGVVAYGNPARVVRMNDDAFNAVRASRRAQSDGDGA